MADISETDLSLVATKVQRWTQNQIKEVDRTVEDHMIRIRQDNSKISSLEEEYSAIHAEMKSSADRFDKECAELKAAAEYQRSLESKVKDIPRDIASHKQREDGLNDKIQKLEEKLSALKRRTRSEASKVQRQVDNYERLGLKFVRVEDGSSLKIVFTQIDPKRPSRQFVVGLQINADDLYEVTICEPKVEKLQATIDTLNSNNDFSHFVRSIRTAFKRTCH